ncbi:MAG: hypothetical protein QM831_04465 [Kofleriaceae bacterium]
MRGVVSTEDVKPRALILAMTSIAFAAPKKSAPSVYRIYKSGIESTGENVTTYEIDVDTHTLTETVIQRAKHEGAWDKPTSRQLHDVTFDCHPSIVQVAPATAKRTRVDGGEGAKAGAWNKPARSAQVRDCKAGDIDGLILADKPIEFTVADDNCCRDKHHSYRWIPDDLSLVAPREPGF